MQYDSTKKVQNHSAELSWAQDTKVSIKTMWQVHYTIVMAISTLAWCSVFFRDLIWIEEQQETNICPNLLGSYYFVIESKEECSSYPALLIITCCFWDPNSGIFFPLAVWKWLHFLKTYRVFDTVNISLFKVPIISKRIVILKSNRNNWKIFMCKKI